MNECYKNYNKKFLLQSWTILLLYVPIYHAISSRLLSIVIRKHITRTSEEHLVAKWVVNRQKTAIRGFYWPFANNKIFVVVEGITS